MYSIKREGDEVQLFKTLRQQSLRVTCPYPVSAGGRGQILEPTETDPPHENHDGHKEGHRWEDEHGVHFLCKGK